MQNTRFSIGTTIFLLIINVSLLYVLINKPNTLRLGRINSSALSSRWGESIKNDPYLAYDNFKKSNRINTVSDKHLSVHLFGEILYKIGGIDSIAVCDAEFEYGCFHGFFSQAISENGTGVVEKLYNSCVKKYGINDSNPCTHGIGHGLVEYFGHDQKNLTKALDLCRLKGGNLTEDQYFGCYSGVFMEFNHPIIITRDKAIMEHRSLGNNAYEPCVSLPSIYQQACFYAMPQLWTRHFDSYRKIGSLCSAISNLANQRSCFRGVGNVASPSSNYKADESTEKCNEMLTSEAKYLCKVTAAWSIYDHTKNLNEGLKVCDGMTIDQKSSCPH